MQSLFPSPRTVSSSLASGLSVAGSGLRASAFLRDVLPALLYVRSHRFLAGSGLLPARLLRLLALPGLCPSFCSVHVAPPFVTPGRWATKNPPELLPRWAGTTRSRFSPESVEESSCAGRTSPAHTQATATRSDADLRAGKDIDAAHEIRHCSLESLGIVAEGPYPVKAIR
jgi:hypothetical protein